LKHPLVKKRIEFFQAEAGNENIDIDDMEEGVLLKTIRIPKNILCLTDKLPEANYDNPYHKKKFKKEGSIEKDNDKDKDKINNNTNIDCNKGSTFPNNCLPDINSKIKKKNDSNYTNEEEKVHRNTDLNNNYRNKKSNKKKLLTIEPTFEGRGLLKRSKLININSKINNNSKQEIITETLSTRPLISVEKERIDLKNSSSSKNKINIKTIDKLYNNEEKSNLKTDEIKIENPNNANLPNHKRYQTKKNKRLKELHKYFNDLGINDTYKLYIPQIGIANSNKNKCNNNLTNNNINNIKNANQKRIGNRYGHNLPNLYQPHRIRKNNSNSLKHYDDIKFDLVVKPMQHRKLNLNSIKI
jgi:hypothetical protein